jgi:beta-glucosidase
MGYLLSAALAACALHTVRGITPDDILPYMTVAQKIGQMTQLDIGMILTNDQVDQQKLNTAVNTYAVGSIINTPYTGGCPSSAPQGMTVATWRSLLTTVQTMVLNQTQPNLPVKIPLLWGIDSVHGANYIANATLFPHATGMAATFDPSNYFTVGQVAALDTRTSGIPWMFSPVLGLGMQPLWSRLYETLGEDPFLAAAFADAYITGAKSASNVAGLNYTTAAACMKHYMGYSNPRSVSSSLYLQRLPVKQPTRFYFSAGQRPNRCLDPGRLLEAVLPAIFRGCSLSWRGERHDQFRIC